VKKQLSLALSWIGHILIDAIQSTLEWTMDHYIPRLILYLIIVSLCIVFLPIVLFCVISQQADELTKRKKDERNQAIARHRIRMKYRPGIVGRVKLPLPPIIWESPPHFMNKISRKKIYKEVLSWKNAKLALSNIWETTLDVFIPQRWS
jgi:hypothetical protein